MTWMTHWASPLGMITLASDGTGLTGAWFEGQRYFACPEGAEEREDLPVFGETIEWLEAYFSGRDPGKTPPLHPEGTPFRRRVWNALLTIPYGQTVSYADLAGMLSQGGERTSPRAVGGAVGHNPISILIPCHRVVGADGSLTGYAGGVERKQALLALEGVE